MAAGSSLTQAVAGGGGGGVLVSLETESRNCISHPVLFRDVENEQRT